MVMMSDHDYEVEAIEAVKIAYPDSTNWQILSVLPGFYDGALVVVALWSGEKHRGQVNVYFDEGNRPTVFAMTEDLAKALGARRPREKWELSTSIKFMEKNILRSKYLRSYPKK